MRASARSCRVSQCQCRGHAVALAYARTFCDDISQRLCCDSRSWTNCNASKHLCASRRRAATLKLRACSGFPSLWSAPASSSWNYPSAHRCWCVTRAAWAAQTQTFPRKSGAESRRRSALGQAVDSTRLDLAVRAGRLFWRRLNVGSRGARTVCFGATVSKPTGFIINEPYESLGKNFQVPPACAPRSAEILAFLSPLKY